MSGLADSGNDTDRDRAVLARRRHGGKDTSLDMWYELVVC